MRRFEAHIPWNMIEKRERGGHAHKTSDLNKSSFYTGIRWYATVGATDSVAPATQGKDQFFRVPSADIYNIPRCSLVFPELFSGNGLNKKPAFKGPRYFPNQIGFSRRRYGGFFPRSRCNTSHGFAGDRPVG
jgi:hypothetical protein